VGKLEQALQLDPGFTAAHTLSALFHLLSASVTAAAPHVRRMRRRATVLVDAGHANHRERVHLAALHAWAEGRQREAAAIWEAWLLEQPVDALTIRLLHDTYYFLGDAKNLRDSVGRVLPAWDTVHPEYLRVCGMFAFGAEECGSYALAEDQGMRALSEDSADPWALHAVVHVYEMLGRRYEGQRLLRETRWFWDASNMMHVHLHWHWGLFQIEEGQFERAFVRYDWWLREYHSGSMLDLIDSASLLWRLELAGNEAYDRWDELVPLTEQHRALHITPFNDVHIAMILAAAGRDDMLQEHLDSMRKNAFTQPFYSPTHSVSDPQLAQRPAQRDAVDDVAWGWGLPAAADAPPSTGAEGGEGGSTQERDAAAFKAELKYAMKAHLQTEAAAAAGGATVGDALAAGGALGGSEQVALSSHSDLAPAASSRNALSPSSSGSGQVSATSGVISQQEVSHFPAGFHSSGAHALAELDDATSALQALGGSPATGHSADIELSEDDAGFTSVEDPFSLEAASARGAGGHMPRPVLTAPFSTLPVLPLRVPEVFEASGGADLPPSAFGGDLVSVGGVGGFGLGSHSVHDMRYIGATVGVPLAEGMVAYRHGDYATAVDKLLPLRGIWHHVGGSAAQRDVFALTLEAAATQSNQLLLARALLRERITNRPNNAMGMYHLSSVLFGTGEAKAAGQMRDRAHRFGLGQERVSTPQRNALTKTDDSWYG